jgi:ubiquinone/menaquinone biosynthesis C-methylase UbiE
MPIFRTIHRFLLRQTMPHAAVGYYDRMLEGLEDLYLAPFVSQIETAFPGPLRVLDVGTGPGHLPVLLAQRNPGYEVMGVDLSEPSLALGRERARRAGVSDRVEFRREDMSGSDLPGGSFDLVLSTCSLHHWRWPEKVLRESARVLRPDGEIWIIDDRGGTTATERATWIKQVREASGKRLHLFRLVYGMEARFLAYTEEEIAEHISGSNLVLRSFEPVGVFFVARISQA